MISFYPGPSKMNPNLGVFLAKASESGLLSMNHRSKAFENLYSQTSDLLKNWLSIPDYFDLLFFSSATECWQVLSQHSFAQKRLHFFNGAFGQKWAEVSTELNDSEHILQSFEIDEVPILPNQENIRFVALTQCETSNGTYIPNNVFSQIRKTYPEAVIAVDATSAMAGIITDWNQADIWFASVQKCFGLPSGLAVMWVNKELTQKILNQKPSIQYYNSLQNSILNQQKWQTTHTPNILCIFLLNQLAQTFLPNYEELDFSMNSWLTFFENKNRIQTLVQNTELQSPTVLALRFECQQAKLLKEFLYKEGFVIGNGYGNWKEKSVRIANFPAHTLDEKIRLMELIDDFLENKLL